MIALGIMFSIVSCSDDDKKSFKDEDPLASYVSQAGFTKVTDYVDSENYEFGLVFSPTVKGKIKAIKVKLPGANPSLRVTIWDKTSKTILMTEMVNVQTANVLVTKEIAPMNLEKDKEYLISMNSNDWYKRDKPEGTNAVYPIKSGNINFSGYIWGSGITQVYPGNVSLNYYAGDLSFVFQQTE